MSDAGGGLYLMGPNLLMYRFKMAWGLQPVRVAVQTWELEMDEAVSNEFQVYPHLSPKP